MHGTAPWVRTLRTFALGLLLWGSGPTLAASEASITRTNWSERWITNVIEVTMPVNHFVNDYRTNRVNQLHTNLVNVYATNYLTRTVTNPVVVTAIRTNFVVAYQTNWTMRTVTTPRVVEDCWTNVVVAYRTNFIARTRTNSVPVALVHTNIVNRYLTNWSTLNLTNWETVVLVKTNRITQFVTNVVQVDVPIRQAVTVAARSDVPVPTAPLADSTSAAPAPAWSGPLVLVATRTTRPTVNDVVEVRLNVRRTDNRAAAPQVQQWRVEREDNTACFGGQEQEFIRELPVGKYKVEARLKAVGDNPPVSVRGTLSVTSLDVVIQPRLLVKR